MRIHSIEIMNLGKVERPITFNFLYKKIKELAHTNREKAEDVICDLYLKYNELTDEEQNDLILVANCFYGWCESDMRI